MTPKRIPTGNGLERLHLRCNVSEIDQGRQHRYIGLTDRIENLSEVVLQHAYLQLRLAGVATPGSRGTQAR